MQLITCNLGHKSCRQLSSVYWDTNVCLACVTDVFPVVVSLHRREAITGNTLSRRLLFHLLLKRNFGHTFRGKGVLRKSEENLGYPNNGRCLSHPYMKFLRNFSHGRDGGLNLYTLTWWVNPCYANLEPWTCSCLRCPGNCVMEAPKRRHFSALSCNF